MLENVSCGIWPFAKSENYMTGSVGNVLGTCPLTGDATVWEALYLVLLNSLDILQPIRQDDRIPQEIDFHSATRSVEQRVFGMIQKSMIRETLHQHPRKVQTKGEVVRESMGAFKIVFLGISCLQESANEEESYEQRAQAHNVCHIDTRQADGHNWNEELRSAYSVPVYCGLSYVSQIQASVSLLGQKSGRRTHAR